MQLTMNQQEWYGVRVCVRSMCKVKVNTIHPGHMPAVSTLWQRVLTLLLAGRYNSQHLVMHEVCVEPFLLLRPAEIVLPIFQQALHARSRSDPGTRNTGLQLLGFAADLQERQLGTVVPSSACQLIGVSGQFQSVLEIIKA